MGETRRTFAAGLAAAVSSTQIIVTAGLAEIVAGAIAMGLGGYLAARTDAASWSDPTAKAAARGSCHRSSRRASGIEKRPSRCRSSCSN